MKQDQIKKAIKELKELLTQRFGKLIKTYLFGSVARGDYTSLSDIDLMVILDKKVDNTLEEEVFNLAYHLELKYDVIFGIVVYAKNFWNSSLAKEMPLRKVFMKEGVLI